MSVDKARCTNCKLCEKSCKMNVEITKNIHSTERIRCGGCKKICPHGAISSGYEIKDFKFGKSYRLREMNKRLAHTQEIKLIVLRTLMEGI